MEEFYMNNTSLDINNFTSDDYTYINNSSDHSDPCRHIPTINYVVTCTVVCIGLPLTLVAIYALYSLVQKDHVTPIYVIKLLISDLIQLCYMITEVTRPRGWTLCEVFYYTYLFGLMSSVGFMVCVAMERYLVVAWPLWYHFRRTIKSSVVVCVVIWALPLVCGLPVYFLVDFQTGVSVETTSGDNNLPLWGVAKDTNN
ncbi:hypothetical protein L3Q82_001877 [Scortum barcoo]|uniref:Uncharacterized protein n=1 Tax=Scortum barcoo TaxID=214431 RepID=A0ACB8W5A4_9TELE|nr:hypothetical protein L3Q82_001877 [Scortum barcoo]